MRMQKVIRTVMKAQSLTLEALGARLGTTKVAVSNVLGANQRSIGSDKAVVMLDAMGYDLVAVPRGSKLPKGSYVVGQTDDE